MFGEKAGWERVEYYVPSDTEGDGAAPDDLRPRGWAGHGWSPWVLPEHRAAREAVALFDESSFAKIEITGPGAADFAARAFAGRVDGPPGSLAYTQALDDRGGVAMDVTVTRVAPDEFLVVTGTALGPHDLAWLRDRARSWGSAVRIADVSGAWACFGLWGPRARDVLAPLTPADLADVAFPFLTMQETTVGDVPVRALRVTYVGELGWELYCPAEYGAGLWRTLVEAGAPHGLRPAGYRAIESLRLEKGYRAWGSDVSRDTTPDEAGLGFACARATGTRGRRRWRRPVPGDRPGGCAAWCRRPAGGRAGVGAGARGGDGRRPRVRHVGRLRLHRRALHRLRAAARGDRPGDGRRGADRRGVGGRGGRAGAAVRPEGRARPGVTPARVGR